MPKEFLSTVAILLTFVAFLPYVRAIWRGETKPHVISWVIWGLATLVIFAAQLADKGGAGAWPIGVSGVISAYIAWLAYRKRGDGEVTRSDWGFLLAALAALPLWFVTSSPATAVVLLTIVELAGFGPTLRRSYFQPHNEKISFFAIFAVRNLLALLALQNYSLATVLFPAASGLACVVLVLLLVWRRRAVPLVSIHAAM
jgi:hypothetical protein